MDNIQTQKFDTVISQLGSDIQLIILELKNINKKLESMDHQIKQNQNMIYYLRNKVGGI